MKKNVANPAKDGTVHVGNNVLKHVACCFCYANCISVG